PLARNRLHLPLVRPRLLSRLSPLLLSWQRSRQCQLRAVRPRRRPPPWHRPRRRPWARPLLLAR
ncbi:MAG: hypothetical protein NZ703_02375, partial [Gemmataceae bacterium]|nr:hypothetical protein [Gemmataceae bacterium]